MTLFTYDNCITYNVMTTDFYRNNCAQIGLRTLRIFAVRREYIREGWGGKGVQEFLREAGFRVRVASCGRRLSVMSLSCMTHVWRARLTQWRLRLQAHTHTQHPSPGTHTHATPLPWHTHTRNTTPLAHTRTTLAHTHSYTHLILALGIVIEPTVCGFIASNQCHIFDEK